MTKGELGLEKINKLEESKKKYNSLMGYVKKIDQGFQKLGASFKLPVVETLFGDIFESFPEVEFMSKSMYVDFTNRIQELDVLCNKIDMDFREIGSDFGSFSLFEFISLAIELLEIGTYDILICPDYPSTSEVLYQGEFSYSYVNEPEKTYNVKNFAECWDYLYKTYNEIEN